MDNANSPSSQVKLGSNRNKSGIHGWKEFIAWLKNYIKSIRSKLLWFQILSIVFVVGLIIAAAFLFWHDSQISTPKTWAFILKGLATTLALCVTYYSTYKNSGNRLRLGFITIAIDLFVFGTFFELLGMLSKGN